MGEKTESADRQKKSLFWYAFPIAVLILLVVGYFLFVSPSPTGAAVSTVSGPVMYFYSEACHYCQQQKPIVQQLISEGYKITFMDVGAHPQYWQTYTIEGTPTFIASNGDKKVGLTQIDELRAWLDAHGAKS